MNISVVIPNYNGVELLKKNLPKVIEAVLEYTYGQKEIIISDDASTDNSLSFLKDFTSRYTTVSIKILTSDRNKGFSSTINYGVSHAKGEVILLLNTDVTPEKGFLEPLIDHFQDEKVFAVGCMDKSIENGKITLRGRGVGKWQRGFLIHEAGSLDKTYTLWASGGSSAFKKEIWEKLGGFDPLYNPFYWEDIDLSYRALKSGYNIFFEKKSIVIHNHSEGSITKHYSSQKITTIAYRNQFIFVWKNITDFYLLISHFLWLPYHIFRSILRGDFCFIYGFVRAFILIPNILQSRNKQKVLFKTKDVDVLKEFSE